MRGVVQTFESKAGYDSDWWGGGQWVKGPMGSTTSFGLGGFTVLCMHAIWPSVRVFVREKRNDGDG